MEALTKQYSDRGDWLKAAQMMVRAESYTPVAIDKVRLLFEAAQHLLVQAPPGRPGEAAVRRGDRARSRARRCGPAARRALLQRRAVARAVAGHRHAGAARSASCTPTRASSTSCTTARRSTADELGDFQKALGYYKAAYDIDSTYLPTLVGRADLLFKMQDWDSAGKIYQTILVQHRDGQDEADVVRIYYRLGMVRQNLGERKKALNMFEKALEIDPTHRDTLEAVIDLQAAAGRLGSGRPRQARPDARRRTTKEKVQLLDEIGGIYHEKLQNPQKAIAAYLEALEIAPDDHQLLQKVLDLYTETKQWKKVVETIERFVALESDADPQGRVLPRGRRRSAATS